MAQVTFTVNELASRKPELAGELEAEIREAAGRYEPGALTLDCRILVDLDLEGEPSRVRVQFERPGWVKTFGISLEQPREDVRRAAESVLIP